MLAGGTRGGRERKTEQILHPAIRPGPGTATRPPKVRPLPIIEVFFLFFFYETNSSAYSVRLPLPSVVCAFYNSPKERVFLLFKGMTEVKAVVRCQRSIPKLQTSMKLL